MPWLTGLAAWLAWLSWLCWLPRLIGLAALTGLAALAAGALGRMRFFDGVWETRQSLFRQFLAIRELEDTWQSRNKRLSTGSMQETTLPWRHEPLTCPWHWPGRVLLAGTNFFDNVWGAWSDVWGAWNPIGRVWSSVWEGLETRPGAWDDGEGPERRFVTPVDGALAGTRFFDDVWGAWNDVWRARNRIWAAWKGVWEDLERRSRAWDVGEAWNDALGAPAEGPRTTFRAETSFWDSWAPSGPFDRKALDRYIYIY